MRGRDGDIVDVVPRFFDRLYLEPLAEFPQRALTAIFVAAPLPSLSLAPLQSIYFLMLSLKEFYEVFLSDCLKSRDVLAYIKNLTQIDVPDKCLLLLPRFEHLSCANVG